eukprot:scaffold89950_cov24-Tisochrysis_lutea.AAC.1
MQANPHVPHRQFFVPGKELLHAESIDQQIRTYLPLSSGRAWAQGKDGWHARTHVHAHARSLSHTPPYCDVQSGRWMAPPADENRALMGKRVLVDLSHEGTAVQGSKVTEKEALMPGFSLGPFRCVVRSCLQLHLVRLVAVVPACSWARARRPVACSCFGSTSIYVHA